MQGVPADQLETERESGSLVAFGNQFIADIKEGKQNLKASTSKNYQSFLTRLEQYCDDRGLSDIHFDEITMDFYHDYRKFLLETQGVKNAFGNHMKILKRLMRTAMECDLHDNNIFQEPSFKAKKKPATPKIYLTQEEINRIEALDLSTMPHLDRERDRFLISYYFLMRWEDSVRIRKEMIKGDMEYLIYQATKTGIQCTLPISAKAEALLEKRSFKFSGDPNQKANVKIKAVGSLANINTILELGGVTAPKFQFITTHTARRSAATNLYLQGVPLGDIMKLGGWKKLSTLQIYLRASGLDVARLAKGYDFFK